MARSSIFTLALLLSACATPRLHDAAELNAAGSACGLALGELIQDEIEKKLLIVLKPGATAEQKVCVTQWARRNHLKAVIVDQIQFPES